jgi:hypothetical protein
MAEAIDTAPGNEIGTQVRDTQADNFTEKEDLVFPGRQSDSGDRTNVRSAISGLTILFSAGNYMRRRENDWTLRGALSLNVRQESGQ